MKMLSKKIVPSLVLIDARGIKFSYTFKNKIKHNLGYEINTLFIIICASINDLLT
jgi:hypothetical protein